MHTAYLQRRLQNLTTISISPCRDPTYLKIVNRFEDSRRSPFSIHQIAMMGDSEDKRVGEWFGPNTVAQVLK